MGNKDGIRGVNHEKIRDANSDNRPIGGINKVTVAMTKTVTIT